MIINSILDLIGNTPILNYNDIYLKLEYYNLTGSIKDRPMLNMINELENKKIIKKGDTLIEPTSGNMGISLAAIGKIKGYNVVLVMPESMSIERRKILKLYGANLILTNKELGMKGAIDEAIRLKDENNFIMPSQFSNIDNYLSHEKTTALEIIKDVKDLDYLVVGVGTGGTITGISHILRKHYKNLKVIAVEPEESPVLSQNKKGSHGIQGIGAGFIPDILDLNSIDEIRTISTKDSLNTLKELANNGLFFGISAAANYKISLDIKLENPNKKILTVIPDNGYKYLSVFDD